MLLSVLVHIHRERKQCDGQIDQSPRTTGWGFLAIVAAKVRLWSHNGDTWPTHSPKTRGSRDPWERTRGDLECYEFQGDVFVRTLWLQPPSVGGPGWASQDLMWSVILPRSFQNGHRGDSVVGRINMIHLFSVIPTTQANVVPRTNRNPATNTNPNPNPNTLLVGGGREQRRARRGGEDTKKKHGMMRPNIVIEFVRGDWETVMWGGCGYINECTSSESWEGGMGN
jgi:hypothetical protein